MKGKHRVSIYTKRLRFDFELRRNITIIRGDSATGKTTLVDMVQEYAAPSVHKPDNIDMRQSLLCFVRSAVEGAVVRHKGQHCIY